MLDDVGREALAAADTPRIDSLAAAGITVSTMWANQVCGASRWMMQTGRYSHRTRAFLAQGNDGNDIEWGIGEALRFSPHRYATRAYAKMGILPSVAGLAAGTRYDGTLGIGYWTGRLGTHPAAPEHCGSWARTTWHYDYNRPVEPDFGPTIEATNLLELPFEESAGWLATAQEPFFVWLGFGHAHFISPDGVNSRMIDAPDTPNTTCAGTATPTAPQQEACQEVMIEHMDTQLDIVLDAIEVYDPGLARTVVIVTGDNGDELRLRAGCPDNKGSLYECGIDVPLIFYAPDIEPERRGESTDNAAIWPVEPLVSATDVFATVLDYADVRVRPGTLGIVPGDARYTGQPYVMDGVSLRSLATGTTFERLDYIYTRSGTHRVVRNHLYKIMVPDGDTPGDVSTEFFELPDETAPGVDPGGIEAELAAAMVAIETGAGTDGVVEGGGGGASVFPLEFPIVME